MSETQRDMWSKVEILAKVVGAVFLPVTLLILGNWFTAQQMLIDYEQRNADRVTNLLKHLSSSNPRERVLAIKVSEHLAMEKQLPAALVPALVEVASKDDVEVSAAVTGALRVAEQRRTSHWNLVSGVV